MLSNCVVGEDSWESLQSAPHHRAHLLSFKPCVCSLHPSDSDPLTQSSRLGSPSLEFSILLLCPPPSQTHGSFSLSFQDSAQIPPSQKASLCPSFKKRCPSFLLRIIVCIFCSTSLSLWQCSTQLHNNSNNYKSSITDEPCTVVYNTVYHYLLTVPPSQTRI